uniref:NADH:ubiquinone oxidoreductase intermediate-associated protein 30 domain-containing protein n=1 Tax=Micromonas pusilla TaxID=38833 RepID=A0A7S0PNA8_MICPS
MALAGSLARRALRWLKDVQDVAPASREVFVSFREAGDVESKWRAWSDASHGGMSEASVSWRPRPEGAEDGDVGAMVLEGTLSTDIARPRPALEPAPGAKPQIDPWSGATVTKAVDRGAEVEPSSSSRSSGGESDAPRVTKSLKRSGFAGCSTKDLPAGEFIDLDAFTALRYRVRSDGRKYVASIRTDNWVTGGKEDLWQCFLFAPRDTWADVVLPIGRFLKTWRGGVLEHEYEMSKSKVVGLGLAVAGGGVEPPGPFRIELASVQGLRLDREELELAIRRAEARWGAAFDHSGGAGSNPGAIGEGMGFAAEALRSEAFGRLGAGRRLGNGPDVAGSSPTGGGKGSVDGDGFAAPKFRGETLPSFLGTREGGGERREE